MNHYLSSISYLWFAYGLSDFLQDAFLLIISCTAIFLIIYLLCCGISRLQHPAKKGAKKASNVSSSHHKGNTFDKQRTSPSSTSDLKKLKIQEKELMQKNAKLAAQQAEFKKQQELWEIERKEQEKALKDKETALQREREFLYSKPAFQDQSKMQLDAKISEFNRQKDIWQSERSRQERALSEREAALQKFSENVYSAKTRADEQKQSQKNAQAQLDAQREELNKLRAQLSRERIELNDLKADLLSAISPALGEADYLFHFSAPDLFNDMKSTRKFERAAYANFMLLSPITVSTCRIRSDDKVYDTSLTKCNCDSFIISHKPCKHMIWLSLRLGAIANGNEERAMALRELAEESKRLSDLEDSLTKRKSALDKKETALREQTKMIHEEGQSHPGFAKMLVLHEQAVDDQRIQYLQNRAPKSAEVVSEVKEEKKKILLERDLLYNQIAVYESLFPWLEEFKQVPLTEAQKYVESVHDEDDADYYRNWLSPEEYATLSEPERLQRSLDKWKKRKKTDWEAGIEYERYIGYLYECNGYTVEYSGALMKLEDMGRDLIAVKGDSVKVIQCKRWKQDKEIHEKHIFQLYGTSVLYCIHHANADVTPLFVTTGTLSETAKLCADWLHVTVSIQQMKEYPLIKCNINKNTKERIYHLPFDQQYDRITVTPGTGECYVHTVKDAEKLGFRHAYKWSGA